ncbi:MAG: hypothetical protein JRJ60_19835, partial [Deltaproteobacteria bacterium]|nr:hypothetical protein [Deltaproteobacteria bacterium]
GKEVKNVAFIQCAGSRDENHLPYCSGICCLVSMKQALYIREQLPDCDATIFFIDIRALDRLEDFYNKVKEDEKITFTKSKIANIAEDPETGDLLLEGENTNTGEQIRATFDMVVLATGGKYQYGRADSGDVRHGGAGYRHGAQPYRTRIGRRDL